jgi:hypothetical protein
MSCSPFELKDYVFGELAAAERKGVEQHASACASCREELERLRVTAAALAALPDEEVPRRIAFVSDKVFEPNWWERFWQSAPRLGFASAAMLSLAILVHAFLNPAVAPPRIDTAHLEQRIQQEFERRLPAAVKAAVASLEAEQQVRLTKAVGDVEKRHEFERKADMLAVEANFHVLRQQMNRMYVASSELGARGQ